MARPVLAMLEDLRCTCDGPRCERTLGENELAIRLQTDAGERRAYECACGATTVTVVE
jgi:hypothetical protein